MKRIASLVCFMMLGLSVWAASDLVHIGTYRNAHDGKEYNVILEYEGEKFKSLEICSRPSDGAQNTSIVIKGKKRIFKFYKGMQDVLGYYKQFISDFKNYKADQKTYLIDPDSRSFREKYYYNVSWPTVHIAGIVNNKRINYDNYDIFDEGYIGYNFTLENDKRFLGIICVADGAIEVNNNNHLTHEILKTTIFFDSPEDVANFIELTNPEKLLERIRLKKKLEK